MRPLRDYLLIERAQPEEKTAGGVYMPDTAEEIPNEGFVHQKGPTVSDEIPIGAKVRVSSYAGTEVKHDDTVYILAREADVLLVLSEPV